jgi:hypothetical protein
MVVAMYQERLDTSAVGEDFFVHHKYEEARILPHFFLCDLAKAIGDILYVVWS